MFILNKIFSLCNPCTMRKALFHRRAYNTYNIEEVNLEAIKSIRAAYSGRFNNNLKSYLKGLLSSKLISLTFQYHFTINGAKVTRINF